MYKAVKKWLQTKFANTKLKKYAFTTTSTKLGFDDPPANSVQASLLLAQSKLLRSRPITIDELNLLSTYVFNSEPVGGKFFKINIDMLKNSVFELEKISRDTSINSIYLSLKEISYGVDINLQINIEDHHEFLIPLITEESEQT